MAEFGQVDALRKQNKDLLDKLKQKSEQLRQLTLLRPDKVDKAFTGESGPRRAPLTERNGEQPQRASISTTVTSAKTFNTHDKRLPGDSEDSTPNPRKPKPNQSSELSTCHTLLQDTANSRWKGQSRSVRLVLPKSAALSPCNQRATNSSSTAGLEMDTISSRNIKPLLGYDWIAGLLDAESSLEDRSEQFFSDLRSFRQANRDDCIHSLLSGLPPVADLASSTLNIEEPQPAADTHQCTFCYRINSRLFAVPLDAQTACPVCKMPKSEHPHTNREPALIRVSIPRLTLQPAYKYKAHRRSSFDPSDSLGLPSHCLSGWSNPMLNSGSQMNSLDLRSSIAKPGATGGSGSSWFGNELFFAFLHVNVSGSNGHNRQCDRNSYEKSSQTVRRCERCTQECSEDKNEMEATPCTQKSNRVCFCKPGFYCTKGNDYTTHCHKPCIPCKEGTFSSTPSLKACKPHTDCARLGMIMLEKGTANQDTVCVNATTVMPTSNSTGVTAQQIVLSEESQSHWLLLLILMLMIFFMAGFCMLMKDVTKKTFSKCFGFINGGHGDNPHLSPTAGDNQTLSNSQSHNSEKPIDKEVKCQSTGPVPQSGAVQQVTMEHNGKGENVSNTVGSIYIYSPGMVILGSNSGDKKEEAGACEEGVPLISRPQQESNPPSQEVRIRISAQEEAEEELSLSFPVPATGK